MAGIDFALPRAALRNSQRRLRGFLNGTEPLDPAQFRSHRDCRLGRWIYSEGMCRYGSFRDMCELEKKHKWVHGTIRRAVLLRQSGDLLNAEREYEQLCTLSGQIDALLTSLEKLLKPAAPQTPFR